VKSRIWISPGAALAFVVLGGIISLLIVFVAVPFYGERAQHRQDVQQAKIAAVQRERATQQFLHHFDCTFGISMKATLKEAERSNRESARLALVNYRIAVRQGNEARAHASLLAHHNALQAAQRYAQLNAQIKPLDGGKPC
jgi:hypothetical protein